MTSSWSRKNSHRAYFSCQIFLAQNLIICFLTLRNHLLLTLLFVEQNAACLLLIFGDFQNCYSLRNDFIYSCNKYLISLLLISHCAPLLRFKMNQTHILPLSGSSQSRAFKMSVIRITAVLRRKNLSAQRTTQPGKVGGLQKT